MWHNNKKVTALEGQVSSLKEKLRKAEIEIADHNEVYKALQASRDAVLEKKEKLCDLFKVQRDSANVIVGRLKEQRLDDIGFQLKTIQWLIGSVALNIILITVVAI